MPKVAITEQSSRRYSVYQAAVDPTDSDNDESPSTQPALKHAPTRHWGSLEDHANHMMTTTPSGSRSTPGPNERREGFMWDVPKELDERLRRPSARESKGMARSFRRIPTDSLGKPPLDERPTVLHPRSFSTTSFEHNLSEDDTRRSSLSTLGRGARRAIPDIRMFDPDSQEAPVNHQKGSPPKPISKAGRSLTFKLPTAMKKGGDDKPQKRAQFSEAPSKPTAASDPVPRPTLKDRRKLGQNEAMKLTLPLEEPSITARGRSPIQEIAKLDDIARPRQRSPKTPWEREAPSWLTEAYPTGPSGKAPGAVRHNLDFGLQSPISPMTKPIYPIISRARVKLNRSSGTSGSSPARTPEAVSDAVVTPRTELGELGKSRMRGFRWGAARTSTGSDSPAAIDIPTPTGAFIPLRLKKALFTPPPSPVVPLQAAIKPFLKKRRKSYKDAIANMAAPPTFLPPGLNRVPTPPMYDQAGEVKGHLEHFFFDVQGGYPTKKKAQDGPGGVWDSDALLMSLDRTGITPSESSDEGSPTRAASSYAPTPSPIDAPKGAATGYIALSPLFPQSPLVPTSLSPNEAPRKHLDSATYFRVPLRDSDDASASPPDPEDMAPEERAKLEWITPEHLDNSPLCPLHVKYRGPSMGFCVYHGKTQKSRKRGSGGSGGSAARKDSSDQATPGSDMLDVAGGGRRRRLISLSSP